MKEKLKAYFKQLKQFYSSQEELDEKMFWTVVPITLLMGIFSVVATVLEGLGGLAVLGGVLCIAAALVFLILCYHDSTHCRGYYAGFVIVFNCLVFPLTFLTNGGLKSGMPGYCVGVVLLSAFCVEKKTRIIVSLVSILSYVAVFLTSICFPQLVLPIREDWMQYDIILSFIVASASMLVLISKAVDEVNKQRYRDVNNGLIDSLGTIIEFRSLETGNHVHRIKLYTAILLRAANGCVPGADFSKAEISTISSAAVLHDIGKIAVSDSVLNKAGRLTMEEFEEIKRHPMAGCRMIETMKGFQSQQYYDYCYEICRHHHERYDGKGYPDGLKGEEIPLISQIAGVADVFEALTSERSYKKAFEPQVAFQIMSDSTGQFSPVMIECLRRALPELEKAVVITPEQLASAVSIEEELKLVRIPGADNRTI